MDFLHSDVGHQNVVDCLAFSPDGREILTGSWDGTAKVWDVASGTLLRTFSWWRGPIRSVAWSPDGSLIAIGADPPYPAHREELLRWMQARWEDPQTAGPKPAGQAPSRESEIRVFGVLDGAHRRTFEGFESGAAFSPDGRRLATLSSTSVAVFDLDEQRLEWRVDDETRNFASVFWSVDGFLLAAICSSGVHVFDARSGALQRVAVAQTPIMEPTRFGSENVAGQPEHVARFWKDSLPEFRPHASDHDHDHRIVISSDGRIAAVAYDPHGLQYLPSRGVKHLTRGLHITLSDMRSLETLRELVMPEGLRSRTMAFSPDRSILAVTGDDRLITLWDAATGQLVRRIGNPPEQIMAVGASPDGRLVAAGDAAGNVFLWGFAEQSLISTCRSAPNVCHVEFFGDGRSLLVASRTGQIRVLDIPALRTRLELHGEEGQFRGGGLSADGSRFLCVCENEEARRSDRGTDPRLVEWSLIGGPTTEVDASARTAMPTRVALLPQMRVRSVAITTGAQGLALCSCEEIFLVNVDPQLECRFLMRTRERNLCRVAFTPDSRRLVVANEGYGMYTISLPERDRSKSFHAGNDWPEAIAFTSDGGRMLRASGYCEQMELFEMPAGRLIREFVGHQSRINAITFSPDDRLLISGGADGTLKVWDVESAKVLASAVLIPQSSLSPARWECLTSPAADS